MRQNRISKVLVVYGYLLGCRTIGAVLDKVEQIEHLEAVLKLGAIAFFLIEIVPLSEIYLLPAEFVCRFYREKPRESIPVKEIKENGFLVKEKYLPRLDYLSVVDECFFK